jgi:hypothetical protein
MMPHYADIESKYGPTKVHLQVFDGKSQDERSDAGTGHDLPLFSMCKSARGVFRAISTFARFVTPSASVMPTASPHASAKPGTFTFTPLSRRNSGLASPVVLDPDLSDLRISTAPSAKTLPERVESPLPMSPAPSSPPRPLDNLPDMPDAPGSTDAGPRWGGFQDDNNSANVGEAGHPGIYRGPDVSRARQSLPRPSRIT